MNWFYSDGKQQQGPVSDAQLDELLRSGKINQTTPVWREGMTDWQPLNVARSDVPPIPGARNTCVECGKTFPPDEIIYLNNSPVCAGCKPVYLQRLKEGAALPAGGSVWRAGKKLVTRTGTILPDRCTRCNAPAGGYKLKRELYWMHPAFFLFLLCNLLVLLIVYMIVRKKAVLHIGLCEKHRAQRKRGLIIGWSSVPLGIILIIGAAVFQSGWWVLTGLLVLIGGGITAGIMARTIAATKIDKDYVWATGCHKDFLADVPEWRGK
jgi:hypothetical protein